MQVLYVVAGNRCYGENQDVAECVALLKKKRKEGKL
jgi:hypothetical protein